MVLLKEGDGEKPRTFVKGNRFGKWSEVNLLIFTEYMCRINLEG